MKLYTPLINKALSIAYNAHHGQYDKSGTPYIYHPTFLAAQMDTEDEIITALLHDVAEDTAVTLDDLKQEGFPQNVLTALRLLTHTEGRDYNNYIDGIADNPLAATVKLADLAHNSDQSRSANLEPEEAARLKEKYGRAIRLLENKSARAMFYAGVKCYWKNDKRSAFDLLSRAMETGLPKDQEYCSDGHSELNAARFLVPMLIRDDGGVLSNRTEPFWFEKPIPPLASDLQSNIAYKIGYEVSVYLREIFLCITGRGGAQRDLEKAEDIAQSIVLKLSFGDRCHDTAIDLRTILQDAVLGDENGCMELKKW